MFDQPSEKNLKLEQKNIQKLFENLNNFLFFAIGIALVFLSVSLLTYSSLDNSLFVFNSTKNSFENLCGYVGSYSASLLLFVLDVSSYLWLAFVLCAWGVRSVKQKMQVNSLHFLSGMSALAVFLTLMFKFLSVCFGWRYALSFGSTWFDDAMYTVGPVGVGMTICVGLLASVCLLFDVTTFQVFVAKKAFAQQVWLMMQIAWAKMRVVGQRIAVALGWFWEGVRRAFSPEYLDAEINRRLSATVEPRVESVVWSDPAAKNVRFEPANVTFDVVAHEGIKESVRIKPEDLYVPDPSRCIKFGSFTLKLLPVLPLRCNVLRHDLIQDLLALAHVDEQEVYEFPLPDDSLLTEDHIKIFDRDAFEADCKARGVHLEEKLRHFGINGAVVAIRPGPVITLFEYQPDVDVKINSIIAREDDLAMVLKAMSIRIVAPIPGTSVVGFEIANTQREDVFMSDLIVGEAWKKSTAQLPLLLGVDNTGNPVIQDLATMPHLLVAGSTGSGKSVCMHSLLFSLLSRHTPETLRFVLIDPKRLEFAAYAEIPHLLFPIVVDAARAVSVLKWVVCEMEHRYKIMAEACVRNIYEYNKRCKERNEPVLSYLVVMIDELADLMIVAGKEIELQLIRIAQMARAAGIHVVIATQRPSVDVVTGLIKVNFPSRLACRVSSKIDSRTILDAGGAEKLLGRGDMLYLHGSAASLRRIHGAYVSESQVSRLTTYLRSIGRPVYVDLDAYASASKFGGSGDMEDELYDHVLEAIKTMDDISISLLQRKFRIGFNRAARLIEQLEADGLLAPPQGSKPRKVLRI